MINQKLTHSEQDRVTLNFDLWSAQRRAQKLDGSHSLWQQEKQAVLSRWQAENDETRQRYLTSLNDEREAKAAESQAKIDAELEPQKQILKRQWLADHPGKTENDFNRKAWIHLRQNLVEQRDAEVMNANLKAARATGRYSL